MAREQDRLSRLPEVTHVVASEGQVEAQLGNGKVVKGEEYVVVSGRVMLFQKSNKGKIPVLMRLADKAVIKSVTKGQE